MARGVEAEQRFTVERDALRQWLKLAPTPGTDGTAGLAVQLDGERVTARLKEIAAAVDRPAREAAVDFDVATKQVKVLTPSQIGQTLDVSAGRTLISNTVPGWLPGGAASREIALPITLIQPKIDSSRVGELGIRELVSEGTTYFAGSSRERVQNIVAAASKFRNVLVPPGAEFSFNEHVGEINAANGFVDSLIIWGDRTAVGIGGGVCQVSTTAFRAAFFGGFPITERWAHGYVVSWYGEAGLDATIYTPDVDLRFRNDSGYHLLIKAEVDTGRGRITFSFYGTRPNRTVEMDKPVISNTRPPEKPLYQEDKTLAAGTIQQVDWARNGMDVVVKRRIRNGDGSVREDEFVSKYQPWRAVYLYGPNALLPADATIAPTPMPSPTRRP